VGTRTEVTAALAERLSEYDVLVEVGVGNRPDVALALAERGRSLTATDVHVQSVPEPVAFVTDDVTDPDLSVYADADAVYALNCPPELQRALCDVARAVDADAVFTTLGTDPAVVPATPENLLGTRITLFVASTGR